MSQLFIADLHLDPQRPEITRALLHFLETRAARAEALYVLGDFFEVWVGDDDSTPTIETVRDALARLTAAGVKVGLQHGNRDFLLGEAFARSCGATLLAEQLTLSPYGEPLLLMHGDQLCLEDGDYQTFRRQVRSPHWQQTFLAQPLAQRRAIARDLRRQSRESSRAKPQAILDVTPAEVDRVMARAGVATLIHGHTHRPAVHPLEGGRTRIVLGDWDRRGWYLEWRADNGYRLVDFPIDARRA